METALTRTQLDTLQKVAEGWRYKDIAASRHGAVDTVKRHFTDVLTTMVTVAEPEKMDFIPNRVK